MISVIIPIYNTQKTLERCLRSVACQTYADFEVLMIDDGSIDDSSKICRKWEENDLRFHLFKQTNKGVSSARNKGINYAKGEYICFIDSDDYVDIDYLETLYCNLTKYDVDISMCSLYGNHAVALNKEVQFLNAEEIIFFIAGNEYGNQAGPFNKLFKKKILKDLRFNEEIYLAEDNLFGVEYAKRCSKGFFINKWLYHYDEPTSSASYLCDSRKLSRFLSYADAHEQMLYDMTMLSKECRDFLINEYYISIQKCYYQSRYFHNTESEKAMLQRMGQALKRYPISWKCQRRPCSWFVMGYISWLFPVWNAIVTRIKR